MVIHDNSMNRVAWPTMHLSAGLGSFHPGWIQTYDLIQHASQSDSRATQIAHNVRQFLTATPIQQPPLAPPSADPIRFQNLDKCVTRRKWLPTVHSVKAVHSTGFPSDHYLLKVEIQVKLGSKIPTPIKPPHRTYTKNSDYPKEFRKFHAKPAFFAGQCYGWASLRCLHRRLGYGRQMQ